MIDPHVKLWLLQENLQDFTMSLRKLSDYQVPSEILGNMTLANSVAEIVEKYIITLFHHWELLGKNYDIYVAWPGRSLVNLLKKKKSEEGFEPHVIWLSNLVFGFNVTETLVSWNWDLKDLGVLDDIVQHVKEKHTGLIATHGTLSDWVVWASPDQHYKVGNRGHIGNSTTDVNVIEETTLAALLGIPQLVLWEVTRDTAAYALCADQITMPLGLALGSTPLLVPYVPFNGSMRLTPEATFLDWNIPEEFTIRIPATSNEFGLNAHTLVGW